MLKGGVTRKKFVLKEMTFSQTFSFYHYHYKRKIEEKYLEKWSEHPMTPFDQKLIFEAPF